MSKIPVQIVPVMPTPPLPEMGCCACCACCKKFVGWPLTTAERAYFGNGTPATAPCRHFSVDPCPPPGPVGLGLVLALARAALWK